MTPKHCWFCNGVDTFVFKIAPRLLLVLALFGAGFYARHSMAKDVRVNIAGKLKGESVIWASFKLRTDELRNKETVELNRISRHSGERYTIKVDEISVEAERVNKAGY